MSSSSSELAEQSPAEMTKGIQATPMRASFQLNIRPMMAPETLRGKEGQGEFECEKRNNK